MEYSVQGSGRESLVFIHGSMVADANIPLIIQPVLMKNYRMITYHRRGYASNKEITRIKDPIHENNDNSVNNFILPSPEGSFMTKPSISQDASDCYRLLEFLKIEGTSHIVGHSQGGVIAIQFALDYPQLVKSLSLLEPALVGFIPSAKKIQEKITAITRLYKIGDKKGAIDSMMRLVGGPGYRIELDRMLPEAFDKALLDADSLFERDIPAMKDWKISSEEIRERVNDTWNGPILSVMGENSQPMFKEVAELLKKWLLRSESLIVPYATHWLQITNPVYLSHGLHNFFSSH
ncbi:MAG: alpha/beta fold hydrolase [Nitrososphaeraceae archaeon]